MSDQTIRLSSGGSEFTLERTITETNGKDISTDPVTLALVPEGGIAAVDSDWRTPEILTRPSSSSVVAQLEIGGTFTPRYGVYRLYTKIGDGSEAIVRVSPGVIRII